MCGCLNRNNVIEEEFDNVSKKVKEALVKSFLNSKRKHKKHVLSPNNCAFSRVYPIFDEKEI